MLTGGVWLGGCFLKGDQLINQDDDYSDLNIPRSIGITGSVDSLASMDSNQEMIWFVFFIFYYNARVMHEVKSMHTTALSPRRQNKKI